MPVGIIIAVLLVAGGGVSAAAQTTEPGDFLYPMKTGVNERVAGAFAFGAESQAAFSASLAQERLEEALELGAEGRLSADAAADLRSRFNAHAQDAQDLVAQLRTDADARAAAEVSSDFESQLRAHERALAAMEANASGDAQTRIGEIRAAAQAAAEAAAQSRAEAEAELTQLAGAGAEGKAAARVAAESRLQVARDEIARVEAFLSRQDDKLSSDAKADARAKLSVASELIAEGEAAIDTENFGDAFAKLQSAQRTATEARVILANNIDFGLDIGARVGASGTVNVGAQSDSSATTSDDGSTTSGSVEVDGSAEGGTSGSTDGSDADASAEGEARGGVDVTF